MKKTSFMNGVTVVAYSVVSIYIVIALVAFFVWVTGGFRKYTEEAAGLKFDCMAVSIADNGGEATVKVLSNYATASLNTSTGTLSYTDPSVPIDITLEVRDKNGKLTSGIVEVPNTVKLGEEFTVKAVVDQSDNFNVGGDCYLYAYSQDDMLSANPLPIFVDVPVESATLLYYNVGTDITSAYKTTFSTSVEDTSTNTSTTLYTTVFYNSLADKQNNTNGIVPLNREMVKDENGNISYQQKELDCVKGDSFQLYVDVYPERARNPHTDRQVTSKTMLNNLDAESMANACTTLANAYSQVGSDEEKLQNYVTMFKTAWNNIGLNNFVNLDGLINANRISQAVLRIGQITASGITSYYQSILGDSTTFADKTISFETPRHDVAEVYTDTNILTIKSKPEEENTTPTLVNYSVQKVYNGEIGGASVYSTFYDETQDSITPIEQKDNFNVTNVYFVGLDFDDNITKDSVISKLKAPLNVTNNRLIVSAQTLTDTQKATLLASTANDYTQNELDNAVNLGIVIKTINNNEVSNPEPLRSELRNLVLTCTTSALYIQKDTTLGEDNVVWLIIPQYEATNVKLKLSLTEEITDPIDDDKQFITTKGTDDTGNATSTEDDTDETENVDNVESSEDATNTTKERVDNVSIDVKDSDNNIFPKTSTISDLNFTITILMPNLKYQDASLNITKFDFDTTKSAEYVPIDMLSLTTEFDPQDYSYGTIMYIVTTETTTDNQTTTIAIADDSIIYNTNGILYTTLSTLNGDTLDDATKYRLIQPMGAGTVRITPILIKTTRVNGVDYPVDADGNQLIDTALSDAGFTVDNDNKITSTGFQIAKYFDAITVTVQENITEFSYFTVLNNDGTFANTYNSSAYFATGSSNKITMYVRANSRYALPDNDTGAYRYNYRIMSGDDDVTGEVILSYETDTNGKTKQFAHTESQTSSSSTGDGVESGETSTTKPTNYMKFDIYINPLKSADEKTYTIKWYKGTATNKYLYEIPYSQLIVKAEDYVGDANSLNFKSGDETYKSITQAYKVALENESSSSTYNLKLEPNNTANTSTEDGISVPTDTFDSDKAKDYMTLTNVNFASNKKTDKDTSWEYVQNEVQLSTQNYTTTYNWISPITSGGVVTGYTYNTMPTNELGYYFTRSTVTTTENSATTTNNVTNSVLYLRNLLPSEYIGVKVTYTYAPGFVTDTTATVSEYILIYCPSESTLTASGGSWEYKKDTTDNKTITLTSPTLSTSVNVLTTAEQDATMKLSEETIVAELSYSLTLADSTLKLTDNSVTKNDGTEFTDDSQIVVNCSITIKFTLPDGIQGSASTTLTRTVTLNKTQA